MLEEKELLSASEYLDLIRSDLEAIDKSILLIQKSREKIETQNSVADINKQLAVFIQGLEKVAVQGRCLPVYKQIEENELLEDTGTRIEVVLSGNVLRIKTPMLFPKARSNKANKKYLLGLFLNQFHDKLKGLKKYDDHIVIWFESQYKERDGKQGFRDHDNIETKIVKDLLIPYIVADDSPIYCDDFHSSKVGEYDATYIHIVPQTEFANYYAMRLAN